VERGVSVKEGEGSSVVAKHKKGEDPYSISRRSRMQKGRKTALHGGEGFQFNFGEGTRYIPQLGRRKRKENGLAENQMTRPEGKKESWVALRTKEKVWRLSRKAARGRR